eukprot:1344329-Pyramimonas_sp.AAC.1
MVTMVAVEGGLTFSGFAMVTKMAIVTCSWYIPVTVQSGTLVWISHGTLNVTEPPLRPGARLQCPPLSSRSGSPLWSLGVPEWAPVSAATTPRSRCVQLLRPWHPCKAPVGLQPIARRTMPSKEGPSVLQQRRRVSQQLRSGGLQGHNKRENSEATACIIDTGSLRGKIERSLRVFVAEKVHVVWRMKVLLHISLTGILRGTRHRASRETGLFSFANWPGVALPTHAFQNVAATSINVTLHSARGKDVIWTLREAGGVEGYRVHGGICRPTRTRASNGLTNRPRVERPSD